MLFVILFIYYINLYNALQYMANKYSSNADKQPKQFAIL